MKLLTLSELKRFDYVKTKEEVLKYFEDISIIKYKYLHIMPPSIVSRLYDINVQSTPISRSKTENYVLLKDEYERKYKNRLDTIDSIIESMSSIEKTFIKDHFINGINITMFAAQFNCSPDKVDQIKKSATIKFALILGIEKYK